MVRLATLLLVVVGAGCGNTAAGADAAGSGAPGDTATADAAATGAVPDTMAGDAGAKASDGFVNNWAHGYEAKLTFTGGPADGYVVPFKRDFFSDTISCQPEFSFGSSHLTPPALSFGVQDQVEVEVPNPKTGDKVVAPLFLQMQFGLVVGSARNPVQTPMAGKYPFSCGAPYLEVTFKGVTYRSTCKGLDGFVEITDFATSEKGRFAGRFHGRMQAYIKQPGAADDCGPSGVPACAKSEWTLDIDGIFGFELPAPDCKPK
ncbi:MAG: hypothetical protein EXR79_00140 [Myxococcales bacterium]|nr:hypothetical protein [Myxococcales bacterium]